MRIPDATLMGVLTKTEAVTAAGLRLLLAEAKEKHVTLQDLIESKGVMSASELDGLEQKTDAAPENSVTKIVDTLLRDAVRRKATVLHIEPHHHAITVRARIDGQLHTLATLPRIKAEAIVAQLKVMSHLHPSEHHLPQSGHAAFNAGKTAYNIRVTTAPAMHGEKVAIHIVESKRGAPSLAELGFWGPNLAATNDLLASTNGLILVVGADMVSATLQSLAAKLAKPTTNTVLLGEAAAPDIKHVMQLATSKYVLQSDAIQAALHQDADVIIITDLHEARAAELALKAALSGKLVIAGMPSTTTFGAIQRLYDMGTEPFILAHTLRGIITERTVPQPCSKCRVAYRPNARMLVSLADNLGLNHSMLTEQLEKFEKVAIKSGLGTAKDKNPSFVDGHIKRLYRAKPEGCDFCHQTGYKGQVGLFEVVKMSPTLQRILTARGTTHQLHSQVSQEGHFSLQADALVKALRGLVDPIPLV